MINGYIGTEPFAFMEGNPEFEKPIYVETTFPWERGRAFSRQSSRSPLLTLECEVDLLNPGDRMILLQFYQQNMIGRTYQIRKRVGWLFEVFPGLWKVLDVEDTTDRTVVAVAGGGIQGGLYILKTKWTLAKVDVNP